MGLGCSRVSPPSSTQLNAAQPSMRRAPAGAVTEDGKESPQAADPSLLHDAAPWTTAGSVLQGEISLATTRPLCRWVR